MPSLNRPNAPNRLPSEDFGDLFFKPRGLRASDAKSSVTTPSPLSTPATVTAHRRALRSSEGGKPYFQSPLASPVSVTSRLRPLQTERSAHWPEGNTKWGTSRVSPAKSPNAPEVIVNEPTPAKHRAPSVPSSISKKARKVLSISDIRDHSLTDSEDPAPREPRAGFKWSRDFLGGWLEIRIGRQEGPDGEEQDKQASSEVEESDLPSNRASTVHLPFSHTTTTAVSAGHVSGQPLLPEAPDSVDSESTRGPLKEGLYCRTKRALGLKHGPTSPYMEPRTRSPTAVVLDRVTSTLRFIPEKAFSASTSTASSISNLSIAGPSRRRQRPGHRAEWSASSSVRNLMMGKPPAGTPEPEAMYTGSDSNQYVAVDLTKQDAPAFLPSEARRINTPPLSTGVSGQGHSRGFFFDYKPPAEGGPEPFPKRPSPPKHVGKGLDHSRQGDWYRVQMDTIENGLAAPKDDSPPNVPEHFPNSPLCPRHPKHKSGGAGTCPYHGRNKSTASDAEQTPMIGKTGTLSPVDQDWWMMRRA